MHVHKRFNQISWTQIDDCIVCTSIYTKVQIKYPVQSLINIPNVFPERGQNCLENKNLSYTAIQILLGSFTLSGDVLKIDS